MSFVSSIRHIFQECSQLDRAGNRDVSLDAHARVRIESIIADDFMSDALKKRVSICSRCLKHISNATIEVILIAGFAPEGDEARRERVVHQFCHGAVNVLHERAEVFAGLQVTERVVMIVHQARDPRDEAILLAVVFEAIPEDQFRLLGSERGEAVATARGDEIDGVVAIPMLEAVQSLEKFVVGVRAFAETRHDPDHITLRRNASGVVA